MDENLQLLTRELRKEICPQSVRDEVARRISVQEPAPGQLSYVFSLAVVALVGLCCLAGWRWAGLGQAHRSRRFAQQPSLDRTQVIAQAENALGFIGGVLLEASAHSERAILKVAVSPLRNGLETSKEKITNHTKP